MARILALTVSLAAVASMLLVLGVASGLSAPRPCPTNYALLILPTGDAELDAILDGVDVNNNDAVCEYFGKKPLPKQKDQYVDDKGVKL
jgi:hypothetical protein